MFKRETMVKIDSCTRSIQAAGLLRSIEVTQSVPTEYMCSKKTWNSAHEVSRHEMKLFSYPAANQPGAYAGFKGGRPARLTLTIEHQFRPGSDSCLPAWPVWTTLTVVFHQLRQKLKQLKARHSLGEWQVQVWWVWVRLLRCDSHAWSATVPPPTASGEETRGVAHLWQTWAETQTHFTLRSGERERASRTDTDLTDTRMDFSDQGKTVRSLNWFSPLNVLLQHSKGLELT